MRRCESEDGLERWRGDVRVKTAVGATQQRLSKRRFEVEVVWFCLAQRVVLMEGARLAGDRGKPHDKERSSYPESHMMTGSRLHVRRQKRGAPRGLNQQTMSDLRQYRH